MWAIPQLCSVCVMVKLPASAPLDSLVDLACRDGVEIRPTLLRVLTDLYVQKPSHSPEEEAQYVELALGLIDAVDPLTRGTVTATLSAYPGAPQRFCASWRVPFPLLASPPVATPTLRPDRIVFSRCRRAPADPHQSRCHRPTRPFARCRPAANSSAGWKMPRSSATRANSPACSTRAGREPRLADAHHARPLGDRWWWRPRRSA